MHRTGSLNTVTVAVLVVVVSQLFFTPVVSAFTNAQRQLINGGIRWYDPDGSGTQDCSLATAGTFTGIEEVLQRFEEQEPAIRALEPEYRAATEGSDIPWEMFAAIHYREARNSPNHSIFAGEPIGSTNPDRGGVQGTTLQENFALALDFLYTKMAVYGDQINPADGFNEDELARAFISWNRGGYYIWGAPDRPEYGTANFDPYLSPYVSAGLDAAHPIDMPYPDDLSEPAGIRGTNSNSGLGALVIYLLLDGPIQGAVSIGGSGCAGTGGLGITASGWVFPLLASKSYFSSSEYSSGLTPIPCLRNPSLGCHHDYYAADIGGIPHQPSTTGPGTVVVAAESGTVSAYGIGSRYDVSVCINSSELQFRVPKLKIAGDDGYSYYYTHMAPGSLEFAVGDRVEAGQPIGRVGPSACAQGTSPHLHIDMVAPYVGFESEYGPLTVVYFNTSSRTGNMVDIIPLINEAYEALP